MTVRRAPRSSSLSSAFAHDSVETPASEDEDLEYAAWAETVAQQAAGTASTTVATPAREAIKIAPRPQVESQAQPTVTPSAPPVVVRPRVAQPSKLPGKAPVLAGPASAPVGHSFSFRGLLLGCALGGIAAALAILLLSALF